MYLSEEAITEFQEIYLEEFKEEIPFEEARRKATNLLDLMNIILTKENKNEKRSTK